MPDNSYVMFLPPDMESVRQFRRQLRVSLAQNSFGEDDISQIVLAADEALTNSITANVSNHSEETIICRWRIENSKFTLLILDYGRGLKISETVSDNYEPAPRNLDNYLGDIKQHPWITKSTAQSLNCNLTQRINIKTNFQFLNSIFPCNS